MSSNNKIEETRAQLKEQFVGKNIHDISTPAAVIDVAVVVRNCKRMLESCRSLGFGFRAHVKTHKVFFYLSEGIRLAFSFDDRQTGLTFNNLNFGRQ